MSRSWTDRLHVYLHPTQLVMVRRSGLFKPAVTQRLVVPAIMPGELPWSGVLAALASTLRQPEWQGARANVALAGHFVRYRTAPWDQRLSREEQAALLRHRFTEIHGDAMRDWQLAIADADYGKQGIACAFDPRLIAALQTTFSSSATRLASVRPIAMNVFNRWRGEIGANAWLVLAEPDRLTVALLREGAWAGIRSRVVAPGWEADLAQTLEREALQLGVEAAAFPVCLCHPQKPAIKPAVPQAVHLLRLPPCPGFSPDSDRDVAMALC